jgi:ABC-type transport system involved in multi-copper enzyme maturation permease subunit
MLSLFLSSLRAGLRSRAIHGVLVVAVLLVGVAYLAASFSPRQPQTVALDVGYSGLRISLVLFALFWVEQLIAREIGSKGILLTLTYPVPRAWYLLARFAAILCLLALSALLVGLVLWVVALFGNQGYEQDFRVQLGWPYWLTVFGLWCDVAVVTAFAVLIACLATVPMLPLALGIAFAIGGKTLGAVLDYLAQGADGDESVLKMRPILDAIQWVLPDLSRFDWRVWPLYSLEPSIDALIWPLVMGAAYIVIMLTFAVYSFSRREFA